MVERSNQFNDTQYNYQLIATQEWAAHSITTGGGGGSSQTEHVMKQFLFYTYRWILHKVYVLVTEGRYSVILSISKDYISSVLKKVK